MFDTQPMSSHEPRRLLLATCRIRGVTWEVVAREAQRAGGMERVLAGDLSETTEQAGRTASAIRQATPSLDRRLDEIDAEIAEAEAAGARLITVLDDNFPANLRVIFNAPPFLFVLGNLSERDARAVAVVGTRDASARGLERAGDMARGLSDHDVTVVSGLARGIDTAAHRGALDAGGRTIAVMGTGVLARYPKESAALADEIVSNGALVSQFWPSAPPASYNFPRRNVVTSGISQGTVVIEATSTSGAKMQARLAIDHGKQVFLVDSLVTDQEWAQKYLRARPRVVRVTTVDDVIARLRPSDQIGTLMQQRRQLALDLASP